MTHSTDFVMIPKAALLLFVLITVHVVSGLTLAPPTFTERPRWPDRTYYDEDGPPIELTCKISNVTHQLVWEKNGHVIDFEKDQLLLRDRNQSLVFEEPKQFQSGSYRCLAYNAAGNISYTGHITIAARKQETRPEVIKTQPVDTIQHAEVGDTVNISCTFNVGGVVDALMDLQLGWFKGGQLINDTNHTAYGHNNTFENNMISSLNIDKLKVSDYGVYTCFGTNTKGNASRLISIERPVHRPKDFPLTLIIACSAAGVVAMVTVVVIVTILRHRYRLRQNYEQFEWLDPDNSQYEVPERKIEYDVFISYSSEDLKWAKDQLFDKLCKHGYSVCIDFKDFTPGVAVSENILDAIYKSHKTIVLMSKNFLKSMWGQFELQQAHNRAIMQRSDVLILIKYDNSKVPAKLMGKTFLDWSDSKIQPHFWTRLVEAIGEPAIFESSDEINGEPDAENDENSRDGIDVETHTKDNTVDFIETIGKDGHTVEEKPKILENSNGLVIASDSTEGVSTINEDSVDIDKYEETIADKFEDFDVDTEHMMTFFV